jgi:putative endonuclease
MSDNRRQTLGARCEALAALYLEKKGYTVRTRNYRMRLGEVDLICEDGETLVFVEVKARTSLLYGSGVEAVGYRKQKTLMAIASILMANEPEKACRFDIVSVSVRGESVAIEHLIDAFP